MSSRARFEEYKRSLSPCVRLARQSAAAGGEYRTISVQRDWLLWQASRFQALSEAGKLAEMHCLGRETECGSDILIDDIRALLNSDGELT